CVERTRIDRASALHGSCKPRLSRKAGSHPDLAATADRDVRHARRLDPDLQLVVTWAVIVAGVDAQAAVAVGPDRRETAAPAEDRNALRRARTHPHFSTAAQLDRTEAPGRD